MHQKELAVRDVPEGRGPRSSLRRPPGTWDPATWSGLTRVPCPQRASARAHDTSFVMLAASIIHFYLFILCSFPKRGWRNKSNWVLSY